MEKNKKESGETRKKRIYIFLHFLIGGILLGILEDLILISIASDKVFTLSILGIIFLVTLPFAFIGEYIVDRIDFLKLFKVDKKYKKFEILLEFIIWGVLLGIVEDLIAFSLSTGSPIDSKIILKTVLIVLPFAFIGEVLIDQLKLPKLVYEKIRIRNTKNLK
jgi:hypothetical protein